MAESKQPHIECVKGTPPLACLLTTKQIMAHLPVDHRSSSEGAHLAFTHAHLEHFAVPVPIYEEQSHLAAWVYGYMAGASHGFPDSNPVNILGE